MWKAADVRIVVDDDLSDDPVVTATITTPAGRLRVMAAVSLEGRTLVLAGLHMHGDHIGPRGFGMVNLRRLADAVMEVLACDEIVVEGATRTSGANPGRVPERLRFKRRLRS